MKKINIITAPNLEQARKQEFLPHVPKNALQGFDSIDLTDARALLLFSLENDLLNVSYSNAAFEKVIGYSSNKNAAYGKAMIARFIQINDFRIIKQKIIPAILQHLKNSPAIQHQDFCFSFNYRITTPDNQHKSILQHTFFYQSDIAKNIFLGIGYITDITYFKEDCKIFFTLEKKKTTAKGIAQELIFRNTYLPDDCANLLTKRELEILNDIYNGLSSKEIAHKLSLSLNTINNHRKNIIAKTNCKNSSDLIHYALKNGIL